MSFHSKVAGTTHDNDDGENRQNIIATYCKPGDELLLEREPENKYDRWAIRVVHVATGKKLGFLPSETARGLAERMDSGDVYSSQITEITGGRATEGIRGVNLLVTQTGQRSDSIVRAILVSLPGSAPTGVSANQVAQVVDLKSRILELVSSGQTVMQKDVKTLIQSAAPELISETLYYMAELGLITRQKNGSTYVLSLPNGK